MRKVILSMQMTLDGIIEGPKGSMDGVVSDSDETWDDMFEFLEAADTFILGRVMYPDYESYWSAALNNESSPANEVKFARLAKQSQHLLISTTVKQVSWDNTSIISDNISEEILTLKQQPGKNMVIWGGAMLASTFINLNLVDEYRLLVNPAILGSGKYLFSNLEALHKLQLIHSRTFASGGALLHYQARK